MVTVKVKVTVLVQEILIPLILTGVVTYKEVKKIQLFL